MRLLRLAPLVLLLTLLAGTLPVRAADPTIVEIDAIEEEVPTLLAPAEVDKIRRLQRDQQSLAPLSPISPDDQAVLIGAGQTLGFLNIQDGTILALDIEQTFNEFFPLALLGLGQFVWLDDQTLAAIGARSGDDSQLYLVTLDRTTGAIGGSPVPIPQGSFPVALSPDARRTVVLLAPQIETEDPTEPPLATVEVTLPSYRSITPQLPAALQRRGEALLRQQPGLEARLSLMQPAERHILQVTEEEIIVRVIDLQTGAQEELTRLAPGTVPMPALFGNYAWSQDGAKFALSLVSIPDAEDQLRGQFDGALLAEEIYRDVTGNLPPDQNPWLTGNEVLVFDFSSGARQTLRPEPTSGAPLLAGTSWSTDGQTLMVRELHPSRLVGRTYPIYTFQFIERSAYSFYNTNLEQVGRFAAAPIDEAIFISGQFVSPDEVIFTTVNGTDIHPYYYNRVSGEFRNIADRAGSFSTGFFPGVLATRLSRQIVFIYQSFTTPPDMYRLNWDGSGLFRLTWFNEELREFSQTRDYPVSFRLSNGEQRFGTLILPADVPFPPEDYPIIVWQEGGPGGPMNSQWLALVESPFGLLPNFGFGLLVVPLAGREGYGPEVLTALYDSDNFGQRDIDEQAEISRQMIRRGWTSSEKLGIVGCSYGGYFALQSIARHPDLYAAANPQCALVDAIVEWSRGYPTLMPYIQGVPPFINADEYREDSPLYLADAIRTPTLTFHGTNDFLPITLMRNTHRRIVNSGVDARMIEFVGAGHGLAGRNSLVPPEVLLEYELYAAQEQIRWFRTYLNSE